MTTKESIKAIKDYLRMSNVDDLESVRFDYDIATYNHKDLMQVNYDDGVFTLLTDEGDYIAELLIDEMLELFPQVEYLVYCSMCDGLGWYDNDPYDMDKIECKHENVMYK